MSSLELGSFRITLVREDIYWWDGGVMFGVVPKALWERYRSPDEANRLPLGFNCYIIETGEHTILLDTGGGDKLDARMRERLKLPATPRRLTEAIAPQASTRNASTSWSTATCTGIIAGGTPPQPRTARNPHFRTRSITRAAANGNTLTAATRADSVAYIDANYDPLVDSGRMRLVDEDTEVAPGVRICLAAGHTRDMLIVTAVSEGQTFCFLTDLVPTATHVTPTWITAFDLYPLTAVDSKIRWLTEAVRGGWLCAFGHDPDVAFARVTQQGGKFEAVPCG